MRHAEGSVQKILPLTGSCTPPIQTRPLTTGVMNPTLLTEGLAVALEAGSITSTTLKPPANALAPCQRGIERAQEGDVCVCVWGGSNANVSI